jgi:hypothetical protein
VGIAVITLHNAGIDPFQYCFHHHHPVLQQGGIRACHEIWKGTHRPDHWQMNIACTTTGALGIVDAVF